MTKTEKERLAVLETKVSAIEAQTASHIPASISELNDKIQKINLRLAYWSGAIAIIVILAQLLVAKYYK